MVNLKGNKTMIAIHTKYIGPTDTRGARIKAYTASWGARRGLSATVPFAYGLRLELAHFEAVKALAEKHSLDWDLSGMRYGDSADSKGYVFCFDHSIVEN